ncbi:MAG TPA: transposase, partial [Propylenella sp.]|nr:transposase [Propylenella sp.]
VAAAHPDKAVQLWCEDEAREGQKGRTGHRWFTRGERPPGRCGRRFLSTRLFAAVRPGTDGAFALALPEATAETMDLFLARFAAALPDTAHVVLLLDQAGWHGAKALRVPPDITPLPLPPYSPQLSPPERVWLHLRERHLSFRLHQGEQDMVDALCAAWNALRAEDGRLASLTSYPWIMHALAQVRSY